LLIISCNSHTSEIFIDEVSIFFFFVDVDEQDPGGQKPPTTHKGRGEAIDDAALN
jgi:hypothetical protein